MRRIITTTLIAALATTSLPGEAVAGPQFGNALHDNAFDQPGAQQPGARLEYDSANRLRRVKRGSLDIRYVYDGLGNLEAEIVDDGQKVTRTDLLLDESGPLPRVLGALGDDGGHELYAYGPMGVAMVRKHAGGQAPAVYHALTDELGTVRGLADGGGALAGRVAYGPFGRVRMTEGQQTRLAFAGEYRDTAGLLWLRARHYAPFLGRFLQRDTIVDDPGDPQTLNRYTYAANNPLAKVDPTGHVVWFVAIPAAMLATAMLAALITPVALQTGDLAGRGDRPASDAERAELDRQVFGWWGTQQRLTELGGALSGGYNAASGARRASAALGNSYGAGGILGPRLSMVTPQGTMNASRTDAAANQFGGVMNGPKGLAPRHGRNADCVACSIAEHYGTTPEEIMNMQPDLRPKPGGVDLAVIDGVMTKSGLGAAKDFPDLPTFGASVIARARRGELAEGTGFVVGGQGRAGGHAIYMQLRDGRLRAVDRQVGINAATFIDNTDPVKVWELPPFNP